MRCGLVLPRGDARTASELATEADWSLAGDAAAVADGCRRRLRAGPPHRRR